MITIHIVGDGAPLYSLKTILEVNQDKFKDEIEVVGFGDHYFNPIYVRKFSSSLTLEDVVRGANIVICTNPAYEDDNIAGLCNEFRVPLICTFALNEKPTTPNTILLDDINLQYAATDMWIKRIINVNSNVKEVRHFNGITKLYDTGDDALPGLTMDEYHEATDRVLGQPHLIKLQKKYFFASEVENWQEDNINIQTNWIVDSDRVDGSRVDWETETVFHTTIISKPVQSEQEVIKHSHLSVPSRRGLTSWHYLNNCVVASFIFMWHKDFIPANCTDYTLIDHGTFVDNIFGSIFKIA